ncbi:cytochrome-c peroxidase [Hoeflea sp.]|uniref:cytochrome-c peroxidase n=1 Tax=Hoeflea sp. TaxID=1940281 RepID=UPI003B020DE4
MLSAKHNHQRRSGKVSGVVAAFLVILSPLAVAGSGVDHSALPPVLTEADFLPFDEKRAALGRLLFYDPILSGNRNISCGTCHHHSLAGADGLALGVGEGGEGIGEKRTTGTGRDRIDRRVPRNAPALFNIGHRDIRHLFHDGRLSIDDLYGNRFNSPAEEYLPQGLSSIAAAQSLFPITSETEMAGHSEENAVAGARNDRIDHAWRLIAERVRATPDYSRLFVDAFEDVDSPAEVTIVHIGNAIGDFVNSEWRSHDSPFDRYLQGEGDALSEDARLGMDLFFGRGGCSACHSGALFTDQEFYALALPQFGPGRTRMFDLMQRDVGRMVETDRLEDAYRFRTPSLRNSALTAPYGHNGAYPKLEGIIRHHLDPQASFDRWSRSQVALPAAEHLKEADFAALQDRRERQRVRASVDIEPLDLGDDEVGQLVAFVHALTGAESVKGRLGRPAILILGFLGFSNRSIYDSFVACYTWIPSLARSDRAARTCLTDGLAQTRVTRWQISACRRFRYFSCSLRRSCRISARCKRVTVARTVRRCSESRSFRAIIISARCLMRLNRSISLGSLITLLTI